MEIPNRKVIRDILIQKSKDGWKTENGRKDSLSFKYLMKRNEKRAFGGGENLITNEWVEPIQEEDARYEQIWYSDRQYKYFIGSFRHKWFGRAKKGALAPGVYVPPPPPEPPNNIEDQTLDKNGNNYYITSNHDKQSLLLRNVWVRTPTSSSISMCLNLDEIRQVTSISMGMARKEEVRMISCKG